MSAYEVERAQVRARRALEARNSAKRLLQRVGKSHSQLSMAIESGDIDSASQLIFEQQRLVSQLQLSLSDVQIEALRERAVEFFGLPLVAAPDGGGSVPVRPAIVYCDPPWAYSTKVHTMGTHQLYDSMTDAELAALPVAGLAAEDAALLMWVTLPKLDAAHRIIEAWGFEFRAVFLVWNKVARYYGRAPRSKSIYTRPNAELLLLAIRGSMPSLKVGASNVHSNVLLSRPDEHSHKPDVVRQLIVETFGDLPRIELFARQTQPDWLAWGNEIAGSHTTSATLRGNKAQPDAVQRTRKNQQVGDATKRALAQLKRTTSRGKKDADSDDDAPALVAGPPRAQSTMRRLERYDQYNEFSHNSVALVTAPDAEMFEHQRKRTRFVALLDHPCIDEMQRQPLSDYISATDLFNTSTLVTECKPVSRSYPRLRAAVLADAMPLIKTIQNQNSDTVFALANHLPPKTT